ncbi:abnormal cell lineage family protein [Desulforamulus aeronauticus]|uniref:Uncharacterized protein n=1 Tax=Desulforamulus aeronauticus DSM 10349 TaxID=1121421 RepID=A0A1M6PW09_9FIRM|nr:abnormal cell lineage family protein [Desulforamulus aeronauticus]SHK12174.1 hypothetical protein SAMN02745123_00747 [Desulforamulus aeronauticus DSM 10349]
MITNLSDYRKRRQLEKLNSLVKEIIEVRQYLQIFKNLELPDYHDIIQKMPKDVKIELLVHLQQQQGLDYYGYFQLLEKEVELKKSIQKLTAELDNLLSDGE